MSENNAQIKFHISGVEEKFCEKILDYMEIKSLKQKKKGRF